MDVISSLNNSISIVSRLREISKNISEAEFKNLLADLSLELADAKLDLANLKDDMAKLMQKNSELEKARSDNKQKPTLHWGCYKFENEDGLFCTACFDTKGQKSQTNRVNTKFRSCPVCNAVIGS